MKFLVYEEHVCILRCDYKALRNGLKEGTLRIGTLVVEVINISVLEWKKEFWSKNLHLALLIN